MTSLECMLQKRPAPGERCDFCSIPVGPEHSHLIELAARRILCACRPCYIVFEPEGAAMGKYRPIPSRYAEIPEFAVADGVWDALAIPIGLAFFFNNSLENRMVAFYPGPAGATESLLPLDTWSEIASSHPLLSTVLPDVEAVLIQRTPGASRCFVVPVDAAYELVGIIRSTWKGFDGGEEAHRRIGEYFERLSARSGGRVTAPSS
jgi:hypothetical protein